MKYSPNEKIPIISTQLLELIEKEPPNKRFEWDVAHSEHYIQFDSTKTTIYYPSLRSLKERINFASKHGLSLSIWDIGQGFNFFFDLL